MKKLMGSLFLALFGIALVSCSENALPSGSTEPSIPSTQEEVITKREDNVEFSYVSLVKKEDKGIATAHTKYYDDYFSLDNTKLDLDLAEFLLALTLTSSNRNIKVKRGDADPYIDYARNGDDLKAFYNTIGYSDIELSPTYTIEPTEDSIALGIAKKKIGEFDCLLVGIRSGGYNNEWVSNFDLGLEGNHNGFNVAKAYALSFIESYITSKSLDVSKTKIMVTGYSRGGAVANLVTNELDMIANNQQSNTVLSRLNKDYIYGYTFEAPNVAMKTDVDNNQDINKNIFNFYNSQDLIVYVLPNSLGFYKYGIDVKLDSFISKYDYYLSISREIRNILGDDEEDYVPNRFIQYEDVKVKTETVNGEEKTTYVKTSYETPEKFYPFIVDKLFSSFDIATREDFVTKKGDVLKGLVRIIMKLYVSFKGVDESDEPIQPSSTDMSKVIKNLIGDINSMEDLMGLKNNTNLNGIITFLLMSSNETDEVKAGIRTLIDEVFDNFLPQVNIVAINNLYSSITYHFPDLNFALLRAINKK